MRLAKLSQCHLSHYLIATIFATCLGASNAFAADAVLDGAAGKNSSNMSHDHASIKKDRSEHHKMEMTGDADYDFATMMKKHHEKGVKMAQDELDNGKDPEMRAAAKKILDNQKKEIAQFDRWIKAHPPKAK